MQLEELNIFDKAAFFLAIGKPLSQAKTIKETLDAIMYQIGRYFEPVNWSVLLKEPNTGDVRFSVVIGSHADQLQGMVVKKGEGIAGWIAEHGEPLIVQDVSQDERFCSRFDELTGFRTNSIIGVPLKVDNKIFGVIELVNKLNGEPFSQIDLQVLEAVAEYAAIAIERDYYNQSLKKMALHDSLTGLRNRRYMEIVINRESERSKRYDTTFSLIMVDVDNFKDINDQYGHQQGDNVLKNLARLLESCVRKADSVCRYGGDEFIIIMPNTSTKQAKEAKERIIKMLDYQNTQNQGLPLYSISVGTYSTQGCDIETALQRVDMDMYQQKYEKIDFQIEKVEDNIQEMFEQERKELDNKQEENHTYYRKKVQLPGEYKLISSVKNDEIIVEYISFKGLVFKTLSTTYLQKGDVINVKFCLDDGQKTKINRKAIINNIDGELVDTIFYNPPPYDKDLGFYLMA